MFSCFLPFCFNTPPGQTLGLHWFVEADSCFSLGVELVCCMNLIFGGLSLSSSRGFSLAFDGVVLFMVYFDE